MNEMSNCQLSMSKDSAVSFCIMKSGTMKLRKLILRMKASEAFIGQGLKTGPKSRDSAVHSKLPVASFLIK